MGRSGSSLIRGTRRVAISVVGEAHQGQRRDNLAATGNAQSQAYTDWKAGNDRVVPGNRKEGDCCNATRTQTGGSTP